MSASLDVALLAPVPLEHLQSGRIVCAQEGKVAFGSAAWEVFRKLDELRDEQKVHAYIYASWTGEVRRLEVAWHALYVGSIESDDGSHPDGMRFRPPTTAKYKGDNLGHWGVFWEVEDLQEISKPLLISHFTGLSREKPFASDFIPRGPILVKCP